MVLALSFIQPRLTTLTDQSELQISALLLIIEETGLSFLLSDLWTDFDGLQTGEQYLCTPFLAR